MLVTVAWSSWQWLPLEGPLCFSWPRSPAKPRPSDRCDCPALSPTPRCVRQPAGVPLWHSDLRQRLGQVRDQVIRVLYTNAQTDQTVGDANPFADLGRDA